MASRTIAAIRAEHSAIIAASPARWQRHSASFISGTYRFVVRVAERDQNLQIALPIATATVILSMGMIDFAQG